MSLAAGSLTVWFVGSACLILALPSSTVPGQGKPHLLSCSIGSSTITEMALFSSAQLTRLMEAAKNGRSKEILELVDKGVDVNELDSTGSTALHYATKSNSSSCVLALILSGADRGIHDARGKTAIEYAETICHKLLSRRKFSLTCYKDFLPDHPQVLVHALCSYEVEELRKAGIDLDKITEPTIKSFHAFVVYEVSNDLHQSLLLEKTECKELFDEKFVTHILKHLADEINKGDLSPEKVKEYINRRNHKGLSALHLVVGKEVSKNCAFEIIMLLKGLGADLNALDPNGKTPVELACASNVKHSVEWLKWLLYCGASPRGGLAACATSSD